MTTRANLRLVAPVEEPAEPDKPQRIPPRVDRLEYPGGHVWRRYPHEAEVLKAREAIGLGEEAW